MIKPEHDLPVVRQCELLGLARSTAPTIALSRSVRPIWC